MNLYPLEVSQRYAKAFYDLAVSQSEIKAVSKDFQLFKAIFTQSIHPSAQVKNQMSDRGDVFYLLSSPILTLKEKMHFVESIFQVDLSKAHRNEGDTYKTDKSQFVISQISLDFLKFLLYKNRVASLLEIIVAFERECDRSQNLVRGQVFSNQDLIEEEKESLKTVIAQRLNQQVNFEYFKDDKLLGGVLIKIGSLLFDGTIVHQLDRLKDQLRKI